MKWPMWKVVVDRCLSLVPPLRKALKPTLNVQASLMEVKLSPAMLASNLLVGLPETSSSTVRAWVLNAGQLTAVRSALQNSNHVRVVGSSRVTTMEGVGATISSGKPTLVDGKRRYTGVEVDVYPNESRGEIRLLANAMLTDSTLMGRTGTNVLSLATNFNIGLRTSFPDGGGVFVLDTRNSNAVLISAHEQKSKK